MRDKSRTYSVCVPNSCGEARIRGGVRLSVAPSCPTADVWRFGVPWKSQGVKFIDGGVSNDIRNWSGGDMKNWSTCVMD
jgi:hypothetical protein